jgi:hypothetical protein
MIEIFVFTNGSSSLEYALRSIEAQTVPCKHSILRDMSILDGMNNAVKQCQSEYYLKIDDDMLLHPRLVEFYEWKLKQLGSPALYGCRLWEPWHKRFVQSVKAYQTRIARKVGFHADARGKIDVEYVRNLAATGHKALIDLDSIVAVHALRSVEEQRQYRDIWLRLATIDEQQYRKYDKCHMQIYENFESYDTQYARIAELDQINETHKSLFWQFTIGAL